MKQQLDQASTLPSPGVIFEVDQAVGGSFCSKVSPSSRKEGWVPAATSSSFSYEFLIASGLERRAWSSRIERRSWPRLVGEWTTKLEALRKDGNAGSIRPPPQGSMHFRGPRCKFVKIYFNEKDPASLRLLKMGRVVLFEIMHLFILRCIECWWWKWCLAVKFVWCRFECWFISLARCEVWSCRYGGVASLSVRAGVRLWMVEVKEVLSPSGNSFFSSSSGCVRPNQSQTFDLHGGWKFTALVQNIPWTCLLQTLRALPLRYFWTILPSLLRGAEEFSSPSSEQALVKNPGNISPVGCPARNSPLWTIICWIL